MSIRAVIFDFFGVICSDDYWRYVRRDRQTDSEFRAFSEEVNLGKMPWQTFVEKVAKTTNTSVEAVNKMYESERIDPRVAALIDELHKDYKTALLTNAHHEFIDDVLKQNHLATLFDEVFVSSRLGVVKPDPAIFEYALEKLSVKPEEVVYIDDLERHAASAREVGMQAIVYKDFEQMRHELEAILSKQ